MPTYRPYSRVPPNRRLTAARKKENKNNADLAQFEAWVAAVRARAAPPAPARAPQDYAGPGGDSSDGEGARDDVAEELPPGGSRRAMGVDEGETTPRERTSHTREGASVRLAVSNACFPSPPALAMTLPILVINPNSTVQMTRGLWVLLASHPSSSRLTYWTAPSGPSSINNSADCTLSTDACLPHLLPLLSHFSGFLIACYSDHPLVQRIKELTSKPVIGIFEASLCASLLLAKEGERFGIVSTGKVWEQLLSDGVSKFLGGSTAKFAGVETTGLSATDLHDADPEEVQTRMKDAVKRLVSRGNVTVVCLGCAGMAGMDTMVRAACVEELGEDLGLRVRIVDGVLFGVGMLEGLVQATAPAIL